MNAIALFGKQDFRPVDLDDLPITGHDVRIRPVACGICGSDIRMYFQGPTPRYKHPIVLGHELAGEILEVGPEVKDLKGGDLVAIAPLVPCMKCRACRMGKDNLCENGLVVGCTIDGGFAESMYVPGQMVRTGGVVKVPDGVVPRIAALTELLACCVQGLEQLTIGEEDHVLIVGNGPIGLAFLQLIRRMEVGFVAISGRRPSRAALSAQLGADRVFEADATDWHPKCRHAFDHVILATSNIEASSQATELLRSGGEILTFSGYTPGTILSLDVNDVHYRQLHLHGSIDSTIVNFQKAAQLIPQLQMDRLISASLPLDKLEDAFNLTKEPDVVKVMIEPSL